MAKTRDELMRHFGPRMFEAQSLMILEEINQIRLAAGMPVRTKAQLLASLDTHLDTVQPYNWEGEQYP